MNFTPETEMTTEVGKPVIPWLWIWRIVLILLLLIDIIIDLGANQATTIVLDRMVN